MALVIPFKSPTRRVLPMPQSAVAAMDIFGLDGPTLADQLFFTLTRRKEGTEIGLKMGRLWWNLSSMTGTYPRTFKESREWIAGYARCYGHEAIELTRRGLSA